MDVNQSQMESYFDLHGLDKLRKRAQTDSESTLREVAGQFESIFTRQMLKSMRDASFGDPLFDSNSMSFYRDMHDDQLALNMSKSGSIGLADMLVKQLQPMVAGKSQPDATPRYYDIKVKPGALHPEKTAVPIEIKKQKPMFIDRNKVTLPAYIQPALVTPHEVKPYEARQETSMVFDGKPETFINKLMPLAEKAANEIGIDAKTLLAQAGLETGWGKGMVQTANGKLSNNLFNIKADHRWDGDRMWKETLEFDGKGVPDMKKAAFRAYDSFEHSFEDYVTFLRDSSRYHTAVSHAGDSSRFVDELQKAGYATDPNYASKIKGIIQREPLLRTAQGQSDTTRKMSDPI